MKGIKKANLASSWLLSKNKEQITTTTCVNFSKEACYKIEEEAGASKESILQRSSKTGNKS